MAGTYRLLFGLFLFFQSVLGCESEETTVASGGMLRFRWYARLPMVIFWSGIRGR